MLGPIIPLRRIYISYHSNFQCVFSPLIIMSFLLCFLLLYYPFLCVYNHTYFLLRYSTPDNNLSSGIKQARRCDKKLWHIISTCTCTYIITFSPAKLNYDNNFLRGKLVKWRKSFMLNPLYTSAAVTASRPKQKATRFLLTQVKFNNQPLLLLGCRKLFKKSPAYTIL